MFISLSFLLPGALGYAGGLVFDRFDNHLAIFVVTDTEDDEKVATV